MSLSPEQIGAIIAMERAGSALSIAGILTIVVSFWLFKRLRTVPNLFILYASLANAGASIACVIGYDGLKAGIETSLCQTQAFLLEMFMQSDPLWSLAMAINVFLVFFFGANPSTFHKYQWAYCILCYGLPALPAVTLLFVRTLERGHVYGDATLWCWIGPNWAFLRIWTYYIPIWICILLSFLIYFAVGYYVFHQRNQLLNMTVGRSDREDQITPPNGPRKSSDKSLADLTVTTEVQVVTAHSSDFAARSSIQLSRLPTVPQAIAAPSRLGEWSRPEEYTETQPIIYPTAVIQTTCVSTSAVKAFRDSQSKRSLAGQLREKIRRLDPVKVAYLRTSFVFTISVLVTWIPSSINRIHNLVRPDELHFGLSMASAAVLPLQGVWNAVIFFTTSWELFKDEVSDLWRGWTGKKKNTDVLPRVQVNMDLEHENYRVLFSGSRLRMRSVSQDDLEGFGPSGGYFIGTL